MPKQTNTTARAIHSLLESYVAELREYFSDSAPLDEWEDDILTKSEALLEETQIMLEETESSYRL
jgi:hypothetical protein